MGLPIISEISDWLRSIGTWIVEKVPKPIKIALFLAMFGLIGTIISFFAHVGGIHCNTNGDVVQTSFLDIASNLMIVWETDNRIIKGDSLSACDIHPQYCGRENECYYYAEELDDGYYQTCNTTNASIDCKYYLRDAECHTCDSKEICFKDSQFLFICGSWSNVCDGNATDSSFTDVGDKLSGCGSVCSVPENYEFNADDGRYYCTDLEICGDDANVALNSALDQRLKRAGAKKLYSKQDDKSIDQMMYWKCNKDYNPRLTFFGIDIFNYYMWIIIIIIYILVIIYFKFNS